MFFMYGLMTILPSVSADPGTRAVARWLADDVVLKKTGEVNLIIHSNDATADATVRFKTDDPGTVKFTMGVDGADDKLMIVPADGITGSPAIAVQSNGNVGIGVADARNALHIRDTSDGEDVFSGLRFQPSDASETRGHRIAGFRSSGLWLAGSQNGSAYTKSHIFLHEDGVHIAMSDGTSDPLNAKEFTVLNSGNVGIGTTTAPARVTIDGTVFYERTAASTSSNRALIAIGRPVAARYYTAGDVEVLKHGLAIAKHPVRFESSFKVEHASNTSTGTTQAVYILE
jgi:hypothetical protein